MTDVYWWDPLGGRAYELVGFTERPLPTKLDYQACRRGLAQHYTVLEWGRMVLSWYDGNPPWAMVFRPPTYRREGGVRDNVMKVSVLFPNRAETALKGVNYYTISDEWFPLIQRYGLIGCSDPPLRDWLRNYRTTRGLT